MPAERPEPKLPSSVFITGANGFIGHALADRLRHLGATVSGVDLQGDRERSISTGTTENPEPWSGHLEGVDTVIHLAAVVSTVAPFDQAWNVNVLGTKKVIDAARAAGVRRVIHFSSIAAYGFRFPHHVTEDYPLHPSFGVSTYVDTKINSEHVALAEAARSGPEVVVIRPGDVYGPRSVWIREPLALAKAGQLMLPNGGKGMFDPVYIDNLVDGVLLAVATEGINGQIFNISEEQAITNMEFFGQIASWVGASVRTMPLSVAVPALSLVGGVQRALGHANELGAGMMHMLNREYVVSNAKARQMLGFEPVVELTEGMSRSKDWARSAGLI